MKGIKLPGGKRNNKKDSRAVDVSEPIETLNGVELDNTTNPLGTDESGSEATHKPLDIDEFLSSEHANEPINTEETIDTDELSTLSAFENAGLAKIFAESIAERNSQIFYPKKVDVREQVKISIFIKKSKISKIVSNEAGELPHSYHYSERGVVDIITYLDADIRVGDKFKHAISIIEYCRQHYINSAESRFAIYVSTKKGSVVAVYDGFIKEYDMIESDDELHTKVAKAVKEIELSAKISNYKTTVYFDKTIDCFSGELIDFNEPDVISSVQKHQKLLNKDYKAPFSRLFKRAKAIKKPEVIKSKADKSNYLLAFVAAAVICALSATSLYYSITLTQENREIKLISERLADKVSIIDNKLEEVLALKGAYTKMSPEDLDNINQQFSKIMVSLNQSSTRIRDREREVPREQEELTNKLLNKFNNNSRIDHNVTEELSTGMTGKSMAPVYFFCKVLLRDGQKVDCVYENTKYTINKDWQDISGKRVRYNPKAKSFEVKTDYGIYTTSLERANRGA